MRRDFFFLDNGDDDLRVMDCYGNYKNGFCGLEKRIRHGRERHVLHSATGSSGLSLVFPHCSIGSHWATRRIEVAVVA